MIICFQQMIESKAKYLYRIRRIADDFIGPERSWQWQLIPFCIVAKLIAWIVSRKIIANFNKQLNMLSRSFHRLTESNRYIVATIQIPVNWSAECRQSSCYSSCVLR